MVGKNLLCQVLSFAPVKVQRFSRTVLGFLGVSLALGGCGREPLESETDQLTVRGFNCMDYTLTERARQLAQMPGQMINDPTFRVGRVDLVENQLTGIPHSLLKYLFERHSKVRFDISEGQLESGTMGVTRLVDVGDGSGFEPTKIVLAAAPDAVHFALQHEVGHAVEYYLKRATGAGAKEWQSAYVEGANHPSVRSYARGSSREYFAEAFANYYCSPSSQQFIKNELPKTYYQLRRILPAARWEPVKANFED